MKIKITQARFCRFRNRPDATCFKMRCKVCGLPIKKITYELPNVCEKCASIGLAVANKWRATNDR